MSDGKRSADIVVCGHFQVRAKVTEETTQYGTSQFAVEVLLPDGTTEFTPNLMASIQTVGTTGLGPLDEARRKEWVTVATRAVLTLWTKLWVDRQLGETEDGIRTEERMDGLVGVA